MDELSELRHACFGLEREHDDLVSDFEQLAMLYETTTPKLTELQVFVFQVIVAYSRYTWLTLHHVRMLY